MKKLTKTQKALELLKREDQITIALKHVIQAHWNAMGNTVSVSRLKIIQDLEDTLELLKK